MALVPIYLGSLKKARLDICNVLLMWQGSLGHYGMMLHVDSGFLQMFSLERLGTLTPWLSTLLLPSKIGGVVSPRM